MGKSAKNKSCFSHVRFAISFRHPNGAVREADRSEEVHAGNKYLGIIDIKRCLMP